MIDMGFGDFIAKLFGSKEQKEAAKEEIREQAEEELAGQAKLFVFLNGRNLHTFKLNLDQYIIGRDSSWQVTSDYFKSGAGVIKVEGNKIKIAHCEMYTKYITRLKNRRMHAILSYSKKRKKWNLADKSSKGTIIGSKLILDSDEWIKSGTKFQLGDLHNLTFQIKY